MNKKKSCIVVQKNFFLLGYLLFSLILVYFHEKIRSTELTHEKIDQEILIASMGTGRCSWSIDDSSPDSVLGIGSKTGNTGK